MSLHANNDLFKFKRKDLRELFYIVAFFILFFVFEIKIKPYFDNDKNLSKKVEFYTALFIFGLLHLLASNFLAYMYNLRAVMMPFLKPPRLSITPRKLKILGVTLTIVSVVGLLTVIVK